MRGLLNGKGALGVGPLQHCLFPLPGWQNTLSFQVSEAHRTDDEGSSLAGSPTCDFSRTHVFMSLWEAPLYGGHVPLGTIGKMPSQLGMMRV